MDALPGDVSRVRTQKDGLELVTFFATAESEQQCIVQNTLVGFENDSLLTLDIVRHEAAGAGETRVATLQPKQFCRAANFAALPWSARDHLTGQFVAGFSPSRKPVTISRVGQHLRFTEPTVPVTLTILNSNKFPVALYWVDYQGQRSFLCDD